MNEFRFESSDLAETEEFLSQAYTPMQIGGRSEHARARVSRRGLWSVSVDDLAFDYDMSHDARLPIGKVCLCNVHGGTIVRRYLPDGTEGTFGPGDVFMYAPHDRTYRGVIQGADYNLVMFDPDILDRVAATATGEPGSVRLTEDRPVSPAAGRMLRRTIAYLHDQVLPDPAVADAPLMGAAATNLLAASVLDAFPNNAIREPTPVDRRDAHTATLRRALAFMDIHLESDLNISAIAAAAYVSPRALQLAFRRDLDTTPMTYLRRLRLARARAQLRAATPEDITVTAVAARWGFLNASQFAARYREAFGELPSQTLRT